MELQKRPTVLTASVSDGPRGLDRAGGDRALHRKPPHVVVPPSDLKLSKGDKETFEKAATLDGMFSLVTDAKFDWNSAKGRKFKIALGESCAKCQTLLETYKAATDILKANEMAAPVWGLFGVVITAVAEKQAKEEVLDARIGDLIHSLPRVEIYRSLYGTPAMDDVVKELRKKVYEFLSFAYQYYRKSGFKRFVNAISDPMESTIEPLLRRIDELSRNLLDEAAVEQAKQFSELCEENKNQSTELRVIRQDLLHAEASRAAISTLQSKANEELVSLKSDLSEANGTAHAMRNRLDESYKGQLRLKVTTDQQVNKIEGLHMELKNTGEKIDEQTATIEFLQKSLEDARDKQCEMIKKIDNQNEQLKKSLQKQVEAKLRNDEQTAIIQQLQSSLEESERKQADLLAETALAKIRPLLVDDDYDGETKYRQAIQLFERATPSLTEINYSEAQLSTLLDWWKASSEQPLMWLTLHQPHPLISEDWITRFPSRFRTHLEGVKTHELDCRPIIISHFTTYDQDISDHYRSKKLTGSELLKRFCFDLLYEDPRPLRENLAIREMFRIPNRKLGARELWALLEFLVQRKPCLWIIEGFEHAELSYKQGGRMPDFLEKLAMIARKSVNFKVLISCVVSADVLCKIWDPDKEAMRQTWLREHWAGR